MTRKVKDINGIGCRWLRITTDQSAVELLDARTRAWPDKCEHMVADLYMSKHTCAAMLCHFGQVFRSNNGSSKGASDVNQSSAMREIMECQVQ